MKKWLFKQIITFFPDNLGIFPHYQKVILKHYLAFRNLESTELYLVPAKLF